MRVRGQNPFGHDLQSGATERMLLRVFRESVYRIDHYLGKEPVQTIFVLRLPRRFSRSGTPVHRPRADAWPMSGRVATARLLRERPDSWRIFQKTDAALTDGDGAAGRLRGRCDPGENVRVLRSIRPSLKGRNRRLAVRGIGPVVVDVEGFRLPRESKSTRSRPPDLAAVTIAIDNWRWAVVPFTASGKRLPALHQDAIAFRGCRTVLSQGVPPPPGGCSAHVLASNPARRGRVAEFGRSIPGAGLQIQSVYMIFPFHAWSADPGG